LTRCWSLLCLCLLTSDLAFSQSSPAPQSPHSPWDKSDINIGAVVNTGNTNTSTYTGALTLRYTTSLWKNTGAVNAWYGRSNGVVDRERYFIQDQLHRTLAKNNRRYLFTMSNFNLDHFTPYDRQFLLASGYGFVLFQRDNNSIQFQLGPGYRHDRVANTRQLEDQVTLLTKTTLEWIIKEDLALSQSIQYDIGTRYQYGKAISGLTFKVNGHMNLTLSFMLEYFSSIPAGSSNTQKVDTITNLSIGYAF
jgi:putative salt-induced outer membrane protein YdiY